MGKQTAGGVPDLRTDVDLFERFCLNDGPRYGLGWETALNAGKEEEAVQDPHGAHSTNDQGILRAKFYHLSDSELIFEFLNMWSF